MAQQRRPVFNSDFPGVPSFLMLLALIPFIWPWIFLHGTARLVWGLIWTISVVVPFLAVVIVNWWQKESASRHEKRKQQVAHLKAERLLHETRIYEPPAAAPTAEQKRQARQAQRDRHRAERERVKAERRQTQSELGEELRLREQRRHRASPM